MLNWANQFSIFCFLDNHRYQTNYHSVECLLAAGLKNSFTTKPGYELKDLQNFLNEKPRWLFGHLGYDLKDETEGLPSMHPDKLGFPGIFFFEPKIIIRLSEKEMEIECDDNAEKIFESIMSVEPAEIAKQNNPVSIQQKVSKEDYIDTIEQLKKH